MILVDTGPLLALFDPLDADHAACAAQSRRFSEPLTTTIPVLTEVLHLLPSRSRGRRMLQAVVNGGGVAVWVFEPKWLWRAFELMQEYADAPMDFADASLVVAAEALRGRRIFTLDQHFAAYRVRMGYQQQRFEIV